MIDTILTNAVELVAALLMMLIGLLGTWLSIKIGKRQELQTLNAAVAEAVGMARLTVGELQQTIVEDLKADRTDGKLTQQEISMLSEKLWEMTKEKMSVPAMEIINAAGVDLRGLIQGAGESWIKELKKE